MQIPTEIKIGGKIYAVEKTDDLRLGSLNCSAECDYENLKIRIVTHTHPNKQQADFVHEVVHAIADNLGYKDHDEQAVEAFAQALYAVIQDNPKMFLEG
ncbi:MAG: hypothetical protein NC253_05240 [Ruminococcus sp.]|nr:hypothetical protein [Ruminococcus sp.]MCM1380321.1 hypothetical protein [Muribaculaceae bacterium]MCM1478233.1 hypothetical protein [Muribaculaceae bacterium]